MKKAIQGGALFAAVFGAILCTAPAKLQGRIPTVQDAQDSRRSLEAFNQQFDSACQKMDHAASTALWEGDGVDLLPGMAPLVGKARISEWLNSLATQLAGAKMTYCTVEWQDVRIQGDLAYEWGINRQKIEFPPPQKPFEGQGKILLILRRQADGAWKIEVESWNSLPQLKEKT